MVLLLEFFGKSEDGVSKHGLSQRLVMVDLAREEKVAPQ